MAKGSARPGPNLSASLRETWYKALFLGGYVGGGRLTSHKKKMCLNSCLNIENECIVL